MTTNRFQYMLPVYPCRLTNFVCKCLNVDVLASIINAIKLRNCFKRSNYGIYLIYVYIMWGAHKVKLG